jgi:hypothetical protein
LRTSSGKSLIRDDDDEKEKARSPDEKTVGEIPAHYAEKAECFSSSKPI